MTAIGMVVNRESAMLWADTQVFRGDVAAEHVNKLVVNPTARLAAAGTGWCALAHAADRETITAMSLDALLVRLPSVLRHAAARIADEVDDASDFVSNCYIIVGWSDRFRHLLGYTFRAGNGFKPERALTFASPAAPDLASMGAEIPDDLQGVAVEQIADLARTWKAEITGKVVIATVARSGVTARILLEMEEVIRPSASRVRAGAPIAENRANG